MEFENLGLKAYLLPKGQCGYIGEEKELKGTEHLKVFKSYCGSSYRFIRYINDEPISVIQIMFDQKTYVIANAYTVEEERRKGYAKELFYFAKKRFHKRILHSVNLNDISKEFAKNVN